MSTTSFTPEPVGTVPSPRVLFDYRPKKERNVHQTIIGVKWYSAPVNHLTPGRQAPASKPLEEHIAQSCSLFLDACIATARAEFQSHLVSHGDKLQQLNDDLKQRINDLNSKLEEHKEVTSSPQEHSTALKQGLVGERKLTVQRAKELNARTEMLWPSGVPCRASWPQCAIKREPKVAAGCKGVDTATGASVPKRPQVQPEATSSACRHIDHGALIVDGLPADWVHDEVIQKLQRRVQQLTGLKVVFKDCTVEAHQSITVCNSRRTTQNGSTSRQLRHRIEPYKGYRSSWAWMLRVMLVLMASSESYRRDYQDVFWHLAGIERAPSWWDTHLMVLTEPGSGIWEKVDTSNLVAELRQRNPTNE
ncbi:hypothetical protein VOLCADRAFT_92346 [Volvox carteri f. nagariensis]|uniref:Uncharacterized protein n=1 Tax=Volvox carteri f. nagariensis TaxID=3068 RepID=D8TZF3_VOLCA|nr:uncharacterized protein VOLCADRAFT_92346 [Volvox carteri f. nagariensis]EFJ47266.1 hypothetical protein VOLCADRAFT_92346 [Volvox carteri f. nagariensis]|eukprot:XP_002951815.1 hypothetical protein VOLCADRAFT_92346 [Volvox carteri f. nagariensis]